MTPLLHFGRFLQTLGEATRDWRTPRCLPWCTEGHPCWGCDVPDILVQTVVPWPGLPVSVRR